MRQRHYKKGVDRQQGQLLPPKVDEYVDGDNPVRAIDSYVESLNLADLGFRNTTGELKAGQPAFNPKMHLKLYLYGYLNRVRSSRRLALECQRNLEVIWLVEGQQPSHQAISVFRKDNLEPLKRVNQDFVQVCKELDLFGAELVGIDGTFMRGNVGKHSIYTPERLQRSLEHLEKDIQTYLDELEQGDQQEGAERGKDPDLVEKLEKLRERQAKRKGQVEQLAERGGSQIAEVDQDARLLSKTGHGTIAGYNVQAAVDQQHKLLVVMEAVQDGNDQQQLAPMGKAAKEVLEVETLTTVQDRGYFNAQQIQECEKQGITPYVPEPDKQAQVRQQGRFTRDAFQYVAEKNLYRCPNKADLSFHAIQQKDGKVSSCYRSKAAICKECPLHQGCLPQKNPYRSIYRWEAEEVIEKHRLRMAEGGAEKMTIRKAICEHVFGTLKQWCGWTHFLLRGLEKVRAELSLLMLAYNFKRVLTIYGLAAFRAYCSARKVHNAGVSA